MIGRFTTIDRFAEKYKRLNPYQYGGNNPISNIDINGDSLVVANDKRTKSYLNEMVDKGDRKYVKFNKDGSVKLDFGKLSQQQISQVLANDDGLAVINNMVNAVDANGKSENFYFEVSHNREGEVNGQSFTTTMKYKTGDLVQDNGPVTNLNRTPRGDGLPDILPKKGLAAAIYMSPATIYVEDPTNPSNSVPVSRGKGLLHEFREAYFRAHDKKSYPDAHKAAGGVMKVRGFIIE